MARHRDDEEEQRMTGDEDLETAPRYWHTEVMTIGPDDFSHSDAAKQYLRERAVAMVMIQNLPKDTGKIYKYRITTREEQDTHMDANALSGLDKNVDWKFEATLEVWE